MKNTLEQKIRRKIETSEDSGFIYSDFFDLCNPNISVNSKRKAIGKVLKKLCEEEILVRFSKDMFAKTKDGEFTVNGKTFFKNEKIIVRFLPFIVKEIFKKMGINTYPTSAENDYNENKSTQIPTGRVIGVDRKITRKVSYKGREIYYELLEK